MPITITKNLKLETIISMLAERQVSDGDQGVWIKVCWAFTDEDLDRIIKILHNLKDPKDLSFLVENMKQKFSVITNKDRDVLEKILKNEELFLLKSNKKS